MEWLTQSIWSTLFQTKSQIIPNNNSYLVLLNVAVIDVVVACLPILPLLLYTFGADCTTTRGSQLKRIACQFRNAYILANTLSMSSDTLTSKQIECASWIFANIFGISRYRIRVP